MFGFVTEGKGDPVFQSFCSLFRQNLMQLLKQRAVVMHRTHLALGISRKVLMCFLGIPSLLSRNSPLSFPGICTVLSRKHQLLLSIYISSSLSRIISPRFFWCVFSLCCIIIISSQFTGIAMCLLEIPSFISRNLPLVFSNFPCLLPRYLTSHVL